MAIYTQLLYPIKIEKVVVLYNPPYEEQLDNIIKKGLTLSTDDIFISQKNFSSDRIEDYTWLVFFPEVKSRSIIPVDSVLFFPNKIDKSIKEDVIYFGNTFTIDRIRPFQKSSLFYRVLYYSQGKLSEEEIKEIVEKVDVDIYLQRRWLGTRKLRFKIPMDRLVIEERIRE
ncbi:hypothetical protein SAMN03080614_10425 [Anaerobranca gottschalkii DSM 13577]|uniref:Uncharacterized protein n=1 Tax=Anaerobranca gottschalkii DSM 13577 TaxID=1120990 RepID=A0A1I0BJS6_9FIRM|nr:hypothetical protein SAMN03080614_10425 [Anaerobranca gottschalkii DSM 13577]